MSESEVPIAAQPGRSLSAGPVRSRAQADRASPLQRRHSSRLSQDGLREQAVRTKSLTKRINELMDKNNKMESDLTRVRKQRDDYHEKLKKSRKRVERMNSEFETTVAQIKDASQKLLRQSETIRQLERDLARATERVEQVNKQRDEAVHELETARKSSSDAGKSAHDVLSERDQLQGRLSVLETEVKRLRNVESELSTVRGTITEAITTKTSAESTADSLRGRVEQLLESLRVVTAEKSAHEERSSTLSVELSRLREEVDDLRRREGQSAALVVEGRERGMTFRNEAVSSQQRLRLLEEKMQDMAKERGVLMQKLGELEGAAEGEKEVRKAVESIREELWTAKSSLERSNVVIEEQSEDIVELKRQIETSMSSEKRLHVLLEDAAEEGERSADRVESLQMSWQESVSGEKNALDAVMMIQKDLERRNAEFEIVSVENIELNEMKVEFGVLSVEVISLRESNAEMHEVLQSKIEECDALNELQNETKKDLSENMSRVETLSEEVRELIERAATGEEASRHLSVLRSELDENRKSREASDRRLVEIEIHYEELKKTVEVLTEKEKESTQVCEEKEQELKETTQQLEDVEVQLQVLKSSFEGVAGVDTLSDDVLDRLAKILSLHQHLDDELADMLLSYSALSPKKKDVRLQRYELLPVEAGDYYEDDEGVGDEDEMITDDEEDVDDVESDIDDSMTKSIESEEDVVTTPVVVTSDEPFLGPTGKEIRDRGFSVLVRKEGIRVPDDEEEADDE